MRWSRASPTATLFVEDVRRQQCRHPEPARDGEVGANGVAYDPDSDWSLMEGFEGDDGVGGSDLTWVDGHAER